MARDWIRSILGVSGMRRLACTMVLALCVAPSAELLAANLQVPATHPRLFYANPARLAQTQTYLSTHPLNPSGNSSTAMMQRALRGMLTNNNADCDQAAAFLVGWDASAQGSGVRDALRQQGEDVLLIYDWCHHRLSAPQISMLVARWNGYMDVEFADDFANRGSEANNYWWGRTRNSLLWGIASFNDNTRAQFFIDQALDVRMDQDFARWYQDFGRGGVFAEGTDYGVTMLAYPLIGFASATDFGHDAFARTPFFREAIYALLYGTTPGATTTTGGSSGLPLVIPFNDDEHFFEGGVINARDYLGDFAAFFGQRDPGTGNARHMRTWLASTNAGRRWMFDAIRSTAAVDQSDLPLDYYAPGSGVFDMRSAHSADAMQVHLQLGSPGGIEHRHLDAGSFQLWRKGRWLSRESVGYSDFLVGPGGVGVVSSEAPIAHNTLMFEGRTTGMWVGSGPRVIPPGADREDNPDGLPQVVRLQHHPEFAYVAVDYSNAYRNRQGPRVDWPYADRAVREFLFVRSLQALVILDRMRASSDSLLPFYQTDQWLNVGPHISAEQVRRTFAMHFETNPSANGARVTAINGGQTTDLITLVPAAPVYRILNEDRPGDEQTGQFRLELDSVGSAESYFLQVIHGRDNGTPAITATLIDNGGSWVVQLNGPNAQSATITLAKGMTSTGGSVAINGGAAQSLRSNVQGITVNGDRPVWESSSTPTPQVSIGDASISEGNSGTKLLTFTVNLSAPATAPVTYNIATSSGTASSGTDYAASSLSGETIAVGASSKTFSVTLNGDTTVEADETFAVTLSAVVGATVADGQAQGIILNDDSTSPAATLSIADVSIAEGNSGSKVATFTVSLSSPASAVVTYRIATSNGTAIAPSDYTARTLNAQSIPAGQTSKTFAVTIKGDAVLEANETFAVTVSNVVGAPVADGQATGTIVNDDSSGPGPSPSLSIADVSIAEGNAGTRQATFTVLLSAASTAQVTYNIATSNGTATAGTDYTANSANGQAIAAGATSKTFVVRVKGDRAVEPNETFFVNVTAVTGATISDGQAVGTITNDDATIARATSPDMDAITLGTLDFGGLFDDQDDRRGEPVLTAQAYAQRLFEHAQVLCRKLRQPMVVAIGNVESRSVLQDVAAAVSTQSTCSHPSGYQAVALEHGRIDTHGLLISTARLRGGVSEVEVLSVSPLAGNEQFRHADGRREALFVQAPLAIRLRINSDDGAATPLTVLLVRMAAAGDEDKRLAQADSLGRLIRERSIADPGERLAVLADRILISRNLLADYPALRLESDSQVLVLPRR